MKFQMSRMVLSMVVIVVCGMGSARADTVLTFFAGTESDLTNALTENGFTYSVYSGALISGTNGNPGGSIDGTGPSGVRDTLDITSTVLSAPFTFEGLDYTAVSSSLSIVQSVVVTGLLNNVVVATDRYAAESMEQSNWLPGGAVNLQGKNIDELRIDLDNVYGGIPGMAFDYFTGIDNVALGDASVVTPPTSPSAVPEPSAIALLGTGLLGVAGSMRRKFSRT
jgi:hypothetical protein